MSALAPDQLDRLGRLPLRAPGGAAATLTTLEQLLAEGAFWLLAEGELDLFAQALPPDRPEGARHHLATFRAGQVLAGLAFPPGHPDLRLVAVPAAGCRILAGRWADLADPAWDDLAAPVRDAFAEALLAELAAGLQPDAGSRRWILLGPDASFNLEAGACASLREPLGWIRIRTGQLALLGQAPLAAEPGEALPLPHGLCVQAGAGGAQVHCLGPGEVPQGDGRRGGEARVLGCLLGWQARELDRRAAAELEQVDRKAAAELSARRQALTALAGTGAGRVAEEPPQGEGALLEACRRVGAAQGIRFLPAPGWAGQGTERDLLGALCRASRVRYRQVALAGAWWQGNAGPLLGFLGDGRAPVALLPRPGGEGGYRLQDPAGGPALEVDQELAARLDPAGFTFYRPGPGGRTSLAGLAALVWPQLRADFRRVLAVSLGAGLAGLALPVALGLMTSEVIPAADLHSVKVLFLALAALAGGSALFNLARGIALLRLQILSGASLQAALVDRILGLPTSFFKRFPVGNLASRTEAVDTAQERLSAAGLGVVLGAMFSLLNFALLLCYSPALALVALALVLAMGLATVAAGRLTLEHERARQAAAGDLAAVSFQLLSGVAKLRVAAAEGRAFASWCRSLVLERAQVARGNRIWVAISVTKEVLAPLSSLVLFAVLASRLGGPGSLGPGAFIAFNAAFGTFLAASISLATTLVGLLEVVPMLDRARPILEAVPEDRSTLPDPGQLLGRVEANHLQFRYRPDGPLVLQDVSFRADPGEFIALAGPSGSGKSTLLRLLLGFERPEAGGIYYDAQDLQGLNPAGLRAQLGVVLQHSRLLPGSIYQNIAGAGHHTLDEAWAAAEAAGIADDIRAMPMGMHTLVSEGGATLSGGQRQRLIMAAALVRRPRIVLLDEATSALDNRTQELVARNLERLYATRIVIAHRLSTIRKADRIYVLDQGQVAQAGSFEELAGREGLFRAMAARQVA